MLENPTRPNRQVVVAQETINQPAPHAELETLALEFAKTLTLAKTPARQFPLPAQRKVLARALQTTHRYFEETSRAAKSGFSQTASRADIGISSEWLLDNYYIIRQAFQQIKTGMPAQFYRQLPRVRLENGREMARIYLIARVLVSSKESRLDAEKIIGFIRIFQRINPLKTGEIWAFAIMLRLCILETLADALAGIRQIPFETSYPLPVFELEPDPNASIPAISPISPEAIVANCITSLRLLNTFDWKSFVEDTCLVHGILNTDPGGVYEQMDFETRNRYRNVVEELSLHTTQDEIEIAATAITLASRGRTPREQHVGYYLVDKGREQLEMECQYHAPPGQRVRNWIMRHALPGYLGSIAGLSVLFCLGFGGYALMSGGSAAQTMLALVLGLLPSSAAAIHLINWLVSQFIPPRTLPKLELRQGIPPEYSTVVVIPSLLKNEHEMGSLLAQLENHCIGNADPNLHFALLTDFPDAPQKEMPGEKELIQKTISGIQQLNQRHGTADYHPFLLFHRERLWNEGESCWMGWERKRGKLEEFNHLLTNQLDQSGSPFAIRFGDLKALVGIKYVVTTDADTILPREVVRRLVGTLAHPLNRAEFAPGTNRVVSGYAMLQPRVQVRPAVANLSIFTRVFSGDTAIDLYSRAISDVYQDLFGEGSFVGKGIYELRAFERCLQDRIPENAILSHDMFEGLHSRCGLATDIVVFEDYPPHYLAFTNRMHRWLRGDWQLLPWLILPRVQQKNGGTRPNDISALGRWKIFDNLRRSLTQMASLTLLFCAWFFLPGASPVWALLAFSSFILTILTSLVSNLLQRKPSDRPDIIATPLRQIGLRLLLEVVFLPYQALVATDAIITTLVRMTITHKKLLQWTTSAHTIQLFGRKLKIAVIWRQMVFEPLFALAVFLVMLVQKNMELWTAWPLLLAWLLSPYAAGAISQLTDRAASGLNAEQEHNLHRLARQTWLFFEHFVGPEDHWLPPDHFQEEPRGVVAHRTSPTNIGLLMLSTLAAYDLGYIGPPELALRIRNTFETLHHLQRDRGHFLNWYDTHSLEPLLPRYISTVDSGNLAACLLVLRQGLKNITERPVINWSGLVDTLDMLLMVLEEARVGSPAKTLYETILNAREQANDLSRVKTTAPHLLVSIFNESQANIEAALIKLIENSADLFDQSTLNRLATWIDRARHHLENIQLDLRTLSPWSLNMANSPALFEQAGLRPELASGWNKLQTRLAVDPKLGDIPSTCAEVLGILQAMQAGLTDDEKEAAAWCEAFAARLAVAADSTQTLLAELQALDLEAEEFFLATDFRFLFNQQRQIFHIGFNLESGHLDANYYDLLASEARIASLIAISKGDIPQSHWLYLSRPVMEVQGLRTILSWSGTMFEYLMPSLFLKSYANTLLDQSCQAAVQRQIAYGKEKGVPWGISESSYYYFDANQAYQYRAFGVPGLGYQRGLETDLVVAPYASILALPYAPRAVVKNIEHLRRLNMCGAYGLYESIDYTATRMSAGQESAIIRSYMAHHQGMSLVALDNFLMGSKMVRRFHADARIKNVELLLQEQTPVRIEAERPHQYGTGLLRPEHSQVALNPWPGSPGAPYPQVHCLSNGNYSLLITATGSGFSRWGELDLTRWRADTTLDNWGQWLYVQDLQLNRLWSATSQPMAVAPNGQTVRVNFYPHQVEFERRDGDITVHAHVAVAADDDVEIRQITVTNHGDQPQVLALTSYAEVILANQTVDRRHPAFNRLFTEVEYIEDGQILLFHRRTRSMKENPIYLAHFVVLGDINTFISGYETDRARFLGSGGSVRSPAALQNGGRLSDLAARRKTDGASESTLDPILSIQAELSLQPYETTQLAFITLAASSHKEALELARRYRQWNAIQHGFEQSGREAQAEMGQLGLSSPELERTEKLLSALLYTSPAMRAETAMLAANTLGQPGLWPFSISGDYPILLTTIKQGDNLQLLGELLMAHTYWRRRGLKIDLVIFNRRETSYHENLSGQISRLLAQTGSEAWVNKRGGIFVLREDSLTPEEGILLATAARVILNDDAGSLDEQLRKLDRQPVRLPHFIATREPITTTSSPERIERPADLLFDNGLGGFSPDGREYQISLEPGQWTPAPWVNVIANPDFGFLVSNNGLGCTWAQNSGENRLTPWHNDPVCDPPSEAIYLRDEDTGQIWSPTPLPARADAPYLIRHGAGYTVFEHASHGLRQYLRLFAVTDQPVKIIQLKLSNTTNHTRRINVSYYAEWVLGNARDISSQYVIPEFDSRHFALMARNPYNVEFSQNVAFLAATRELNWVTTDRSEFLGVLGDYARPAALDRVGLTASVQAGSDPCAVMQILLWLAPNETKEVTFLLGQGADRAEAERLILHYQSVAHIDEAWKTVEAFWDRHLDSIQVHTPDKAMDIMLNRWLLYEALSCRIWGRTALYQSSGAFGFRDQLQDVLALLHCQPELVKAQILNAASRQFEQGDVLHWWHPPSGRGIRTRISDNMLWLPYVTAQYIKVSGDFSILEEVRPYLRADALAEGEEERYGQFYYGEQTGTLYDHCLRAIQKGVTVGKQGLPLMGAGDWNDGMNRVGIKGKGESVWLGWFAYSTLTEFAAVCEKTGRAAQGLLYRSRAETLRLAIEASSWDGDWYRRATFDDGTALGSIARGECQIDSISQSWAVLSGAADPARARHAMDSLYKRLVRQEDGVILLLDPPFNFTLRDPGYIKGYPPGIRENGGQYTHAALWAIWAFAKLGQGERAVELFNMINPITHSDSAEKVARYCVEPYVVAADVYSVAPHNGRGGWTWYTGSASWMYRLGVEGILGLQREGNLLRIKPSIPKEWPGYEVEYRYGDALYAIKVENPQGVNTGSTQVILDGETQAENSIPLTADGKRHEVRVTLGRNSEEN